MFKKNILIVLFVLFLGIACNNTQVINEYIGNEFIVPDSLEAEIMNIDSSSFLGQIKVIITIDGDCDLCYVKLKTWKSILDSNKNLQQQIFFIFNIVAFDFEYVKEFIEELDFTYPVLFDQNNVLLQYNNISFEDEEKAVLLNTLVVNPENRIAFIGNPVINREEFSSFYLKLNGLLNMNDISNF